MGQHSIEKFEVRVPNGEGSLIGDILRKYATRSVASWQVAGYKVDSQSVNFGFSNGATVSYLEFLKGRLVSSRDGTVGTSEIVTLRWNGNCFSGSGFELHNITHGVGDAVTVCVVYARGSRTAAKNFETIKVATSSKADGFFAVPSSHSAVKTFRYRVEPCDAQTEWLLVEADDGVAEAALQNVVSTLRSINI